MSRKRKANITPQDIDTFYTDGKQVYLLISCEVEPHAVLVGLSDNDNVTKPISEFANFVRLIPERPIIKPPAPRKIRSDVGKPRERKPKVEQAISGYGGDASGIRVAENRILTGVPEPPPTDLVSTFRVNIEQGGLPNRVCLGTNCIWSHTLRDGVLQLLTEAKISQQDVEAAPDSEGKKALLAILKGKG